MVDSFKEALNRGVNEKIRILKNSKEFIGSGSSILERKLEEEASYVTPENRIMIEQSLRNLPELNLTPEQEAYLNTLYESYGLHG